MPAMTMAHFWQGKPDISHITKLQISLVQHPGTSVCDAIQQHFLLSAVIRGGITKTPFPTCQNPAKKSSISLHRNGAGTLTELSFRSFRNIVCTEIEMRHFVHRLLHWAGNNPATCTGTAFSKDFFNNASNYIVSALWGPKGWKDHLTNTQVKV